MTQMPADHMPIQSHSTIDATPADRRVAPPRHRGPRARAASAVRWLARHMGVVLFGLLFVIPVTLVTTYYWFVASDQYRVETQFAVRGLVTSPLSTLGLAALPGASTQAGDSYIVADYIRSPQLIIDLRDQLDIDLRQYFSRSEIDVMQRIDPDAPLEEFVKYWRWRVDVGYNSTTGNTTFAVYAFNPQDANAIAQSVLLVSEQLVNNLSSQSRRQLIETAQSEVARTEERLRQARSQLQDFRNREQSFDPTQSAAVEIGIVSELEQQLADLRTRQRALTGTINTDSPTARVIERSIEALTKQIAEQRSRLGSGGETGGAGGATTADGRNLSVLLDEFVGLNLEQEFATTAYTGALAALETALTDARKQQRYFATYASPRVPESATYPHRILFPLVAAFWCLCVWGIVAFLLRSVRDHVI
ncbi:hypothetical protein [Aureimonas frigidaquae]|nr:hypothetical protein [Aureimonas frigidaquae]